MAKRGPDEIFLLVDGYDLGQDSHELELTIEALTEELTPFGVAWQEHGYIGVRRGHVSQLATYDDADNRSAEALDSQEGTEQIIVIAWAGNVQGRRASGLRGAHMTHLRTAARGSHQKAGAEWETSADVEEGLILQSLAAESGAGATSDGSHNHGSPGTRSAVYLHVTELTLGGYTSITVTVQESSDNGGSDAFADVVAFTAVTAESFSERKAIAATVERYTRVILTLNGAGSSESITLLVAITD